MNRDHNSVQVGVRAIDIGHGNVKAVVGQRLQRGELETVMFPALAPRFTVDSQSTGSDLTGHVVEVDGVDYFVGEDALMASSGIEPRTVPADYAVSPTALALARGALYRMTESQGRVGELVIEHCVFGLPITTYSKYRDAVLEMMQGEHLLGRSGGERRRVTIQKAHVLPQPHGALLHYVSTRGGKVDGWTLVIDVGGGTLDWYVANQQKTAWARCGAYNKSMLACSYAIADKLGTGLRDSPNLVDRIDRAVRGEASGFRIKAEEHKIADFQQLIDGVMEESVNKMFASLKHADDIDQVVLTGGGAKVFQKYLLAKHAHLEKILHIDENPIMSNVRGFQIFGECQRLVTKAS